MDVCRLCCENKGTIYIFDETNSVSKKIMFCCANIQINEKDGLPTHVCALCEELLSNTYSFILKCQVSDAKLRSLTMSTNLVECKVKQEVKLEENDDIHLEDYSGGDMNDFMTKPEIKPEQDSACKESITPKVMTTKISKRSKVQRSLEPLKCEECGLKYKTNSALLQHQRKHSDYRAFECTLCDKKYKDRGGLKRHNNSQHNDDTQNHKFICETCGKSFVKKHTLVVHIRIHSGETPYECQFCHKQFNQLSSLLRHKRQLHTKRERSHSCPKCNKKFYSKELLGKHMMVHTSEKKYICTICNVPFKYANNLTKHMKSHNWLVQFICDYCKQTFASKSNLKVHITKTHSDRSGFCDICSKNVSNYQSHLYKHNGQTPYKCELCPSSFSRNNSLIQHIKFKHVNLDKFMCSINDCTEAFPTRTMLSFHVAKYHEAKTLFSCDGCSKGFYRKTDYTKHKLICQKVKLEL